MAVKDDHPQKAKRKASEQKQEGAGKRIKPNSVGKKDIQSAPQAAEKAKGGPASGKQQEKQQKQQKHRSKIIQDAIMKWETLRRHDITNKQREELISTLLQELKGSLSGMAASPSGSRILQACVKHGSPEQRSPILDELQPSFLELSKSPYAHFLVCKLIDTAPKSATEGFMKTFRGQVVKLMRHPCGSRVINELYTRASGKQRKLLAAEFYGREMVIFSQDAAPKTLAECLGSMDDTGKHRVVQQMSINLIPVLEKGLLDPILVHGLVAEYMEAAPPTAVADVVEMLAGPPLLHMVHSRPGATAACQVLAMATAKQRKKVIKAMKGHVKVMAADEWAHVVLMAALEHTDDTALLRKTLVPELLADLGDLCQHKVACNIFLHLLAPSNRAYLPPHVSALLVPRPALAVSTKSAPETPAAATDVLEVEIATTVAAPVSSKKDAVLRRQELLSSGKGSLAAELTSVCATNATKLLLNPRGCDLLVEAACGSEGGLLVDACPEGVATVQDAVVAATGEEPGTSDEGLTEPVMENFFGSRALKKLIGRGQGSDRAASEARKVAAKLWESSMKGKCKAVSSSHAAKVLAAVFLFADAETRENVKRELLTVMKDEGSIEAWANRSLGAQAEAKQTPEQQQRKKKKNEDSFSEIPELYL